MQQDRKVSIQVRTATTVQCPNRQQVEPTDEIFHSIEPEEDLSQSADRTGSLPHTLRQGPLRGSRIRIVLRYEVHLEHFLDAGGPPPSYKTVDGDTLH